MLSGVTAMGSLCNGLSTEGGSVSIRSASLGSCLMETTKVPVVLDEKPLRAPLQHPASLGLLTGRTCGLGGDTCNRDSSPQH